MATEGKIPVGETIASAFRFTFKGFPTLLGLIWLPIAIMTAAGYAWMVPYFNATQAMVGNQDFGPVLAAAPWFLLSMIIFLICWAMALVAVTRQALELRSGPAYFYFSLDLAVWRLIGTMVLAGVLAMGSFFLFMLLVAVAGMAAGPGAGIVAVLSIFVLLPAYIYGAARLLFFLATVVVAEPGRAIRRAWQLGKGNFWRIFVIGVVLLIPSCAIQSVTQAIIFSAVPPMPVANATPEQMVGWMQGVQAAMMDLWPVWTVAGALIFILQIGLFAAASASAYRAMVSSTRIADEFS